MKRINLIYAITFILLSACGGTTEKESTKTEKPKEKIYPGITYVDKQEEINFDEENVMKFYVIAEGTKPEVLVEFCMDQKKKPKGIFNHYVFFSKKEDIEHSKPNVNAFYSKNYEVMDKIVAHYQHNTFNNYSKLDGYGLGIVTIE